MSDNKIIKNDSKAYGYNYASLADMARQGVDIPQMTTKLVDGVEFVFYKQDNEWLQGARVIVGIDMKGMNPAQAYGAALTYARRYTVALANGLVTDDDDKIERHEPTTSKPIKPSQKQLDYIKNMAKISGMSDDEINEKLAKITTASLASATIKKMKEDK